jgi:RecJ-like exonuclease
MFKCTDCGHLFEYGEEKIQKENHGEEWSVCPCCGGDYEEIMPCKICGSYEHEQNEKFCNECKEKTKNKFVAFIDENFSLEERKLLNELYDGERI